MKKGYIEVLEYINKKGKVFPALSALTFGIRVDTMNRIFNELRRQDYLEKVEREGKLACFIITDKGREMVDNST